MMYRLWILHVSNVFNLERCLQNMLISVSIKHKSTYVFCFLFLLADKWSKYQASAELTRVSMV